MVVFLSYFKKNGKIADEVLPLKTNVKTISISANMTLIVNIKLLEGNLGKIYGRSSLFKELLWKIQLNSGNLYNNYADEL